MTYILLGVSIGLNLYLIMLVVGYRESNRDLGQYINDLEKELNDWR